MIVANTNLFDPLRPASGRRNSLTFELWLPMLLFGSMGAISWAIRGSAGWGGVDGTVLPGLMWGLLWYYLCLLRGIDARGIVFWLGLGIALGGELGYGQYVSWIQGRFNVGVEVVPISPVIGYAWFFLCGIAWAAPGGVILGWALGGKAPAKQWLVRSVLLIFLLLILFDWPLVDWLGRQFVRFWPALLFPHADLGLYSGELGKHLARTVYTNTQNFAVVVWWGAALIVAAIQRARKTLVTGLLLGGGFGLGFLQSAVWCLGYSFAPDFIDWWKLWELNAGFNLGCLYAIILFWATRHVEKKHSSIDADKQKKIRLTKKAGAWSETIFLAVGGSLLLFFMGFEYFFRTGVFLATLFFIGMILSGAPRQQSSLADVAARRRNFSFVYSIFLLIFLMFHGASERAGILLGLYNADAVEQYAWPAARTALFVPFAIVIILVALRAMWQVAKNPDPRRLATAKKSERLIDLMTGMGFIGALSIWPAKIGVAYAFFLMTALFAFTRLHRRHSDVQRNKN